MFVFPLRRALFFLYLVGLFLVGACSGDGATGEEAPEICCVAESQVCVDGALFKCDAAALGAEPDEAGITSGFDLQITSCPSGACNGDDCASKQCSGTVGSTRCGSDGKLVTCTASGTEQETDCGDGETCLGGACVEVPCSVGSTRCSGSDLMECSEAGVYEQKERCSDTGQACSSLTKACAAPQCSAFERLCYGGKVVLCDDQGFVEDELQCADGSSCREGHCVPSICGGGVIMADATGSEDTGGSNPTPDIGAPPETFTIQDVVASKPDVKAPSLASVVVDGEKLIFSSYKTAAWISTGTQGNPDQGKALQISMAKGVLKLELLITGLQEGQVGEWDDTDKSVVQVEVRYSDGLTETPDPQSAGCSTVGWTSCSKTYRVELTAFGTVGQHVKGNYNATLFDNTAFTEGEFDLERIQ